MVSEWLTLIHGGRVWFIEVDHVGRWTSIGISVCGSYAHYERRSYRPSRQEHTLAGWVRNVCREDCHLGEVQPTQSKKNKSLHRTHLKQAVSLLGSPLGTTVFPFPDKASVI